MTHLPLNRPRRLRNTPALRQMVTETRLDPSMFVLPVFVVPGIGVRREIPSMPGNYQLSVDELLPLAQEAESVGVGGMIFFGIPETKDEEGTSAWDPDGPVPQAIAAIKEQTPGLVTWADVCMCEYTSHGHCGFLEGESIENDATLPLLAKAALTYASAGADVIAPSAMMDGQVGVIRGALDDAGFGGIAICSYSVKYSSAFYGPFRDAVDSTPSFGDRRTHQMDPPNIREARLEVKLDVLEGADMVMVKPAGPYLDVIKEVREIVDLPVAAFQVSGEFSMIKAASEQGWVDGDRVMMESLIGIVRAGADIVLTYFAIDAARALKENP